MRFLRRHDSESRLPGLHGLVELDDLVARGLSGIQAKRRVGCGEINDGRELIRMHAQLSEGARQASFSAQGIDGIEEDHPVHAARERGVVGVIADISERKYAEELIEKRIVALTQPLDVAAADTGAGFGAVDGPPITTTGRAS